MTTNTDPANSVMYMLGEIRGDVKSILAAQAARDGRVGVLEDRVGALERSRAYFLGWSAAFAALVGAAFHYLPKIGAGH